MNRTRRGTLETFASGLATYALCCKVRWQGLLTGAYYYRATLRPFPPGHEHDTARMGYGMMFTPQGQVRALALQEKLMHRIAGSTPMRCKTAWAEDDGLVAVMGTRSADAARAGILACNLSLEPRSLQVRVVGRCAERVKSAVSLELAPGGLHERPGPALQRAGRELMVRVDLPMFTSTLLELA